eukprot:TRINITY_DN12769_c0_g2_i1.p1 TRINITY_DN12769_c0_g2~~TRINITY_DN12769_c0_g2_i1.p1  ORF type:complete len:877 (-),score=207.21 TRINITY_DN12769_c0_g2_i1:99-2702(-)
MAPSRPLPRVVLSELAPAEKERMLSFLVANKVNFVPDESGKTLSATVRVVRPGESPGSDGQDTLSNASHGGASRFKLQRPPVPRRGGGGLGARNRFDLSASVQSGRGTPRAASEERKRADEDVNPAKAANLLFAQLEMRKQYSRFTNLLPPVVAPPKMMLKGELLSVMEEIYNSRFNQDIQLLQQQEEEATNSSPSSVSSRKKKPKGVAGPLPFPASVVTHVSKRYGLKQMVGQVCWGLCRTVKALRPEHEGVELFGRFLEESYDYFDLLFYLSARNTARKVVSPSSTWCRAWRQSGQAFDSKHRSLGGQATAAKQSPLQAPAATPAPASSSRPRLDEKQAVTVIRDVVEQEQLKASIFERLTEAFESDEVKESQGIEWDRFLMILTEEFHKGRGTIEGLPDRAEAMVDSDGNKISDFVRLVRETWGIGMRDAFKRFDTDGSGAISQDEFQSVVTNSLAYAGDLDDLWRVIDKHGRGHVLEEEWSAVQLDTSPLQADHEIEDGEESFSLPAGWDRGLNPEEQGQILEEASRVADRLISSLEAQGEQDIDAAEVEAWAMHVVLKRRGKTFKDPGDAKKNKAKKGKGNSKGSQKTAYAVSLAEMDQAVQGFNQESAYKPKMIAEKAKHGMQGTLSSFSGSEEGAGSPKHDDDLEVTVRRLLGEATQELVDQAMLTASGVGDLDQDTSAWLKEALLEEFLPKTDVLMEALVVGNLETWLRQLDVEPPGSQQQRTHFQALRAEFQKALDTVDSEEVNEAVVAKVCRATVSASELRTSCCHRAAELLVEHQVEVAPMTPDFSTAALSPVGHVEQLDAFTGERRIPADFSAVLAPGSSASQSPEAAVEEDEELASAAAEAAQTGESAVEEASP